jgi:undecaprenyl pyrophosphate synthase
MEDELRALKELVEETAKKYEIYISIFSFYGRKADLTHATEQEAESNNYHTL